MEVTHEGSMSIYNRLVANPPAGPRAPMRQPREDGYQHEGKSVVAMVRADDRRKGIVEALIAAGIPPSRIVVGDMSGKNRGLPTRATMENLGITGVAEELGIGLAYFEEEEWVTVEPPLSRHWPGGIKIPRRIYEADRVILTPIMRSHNTATFTISLKLAVGLIDAEAREWLHDGREFYEKMIELNLAYSADLVIADATKILVDKELTPFKAAEPGIIIASGNRVASDAVCVALMKQHSVEGVSDRPVLSQEQFAVCERLGLGSPRLEKMELRTSNVAGDGRFGDLISGIEEELSG